MTSPTTFRARFLTAATITLAALTGSALVAPPAQAANTGYYLDCSATSNGTGTQASPWNTVTSVNAPTFGPGDTINVKAGTTCTGQLTPKGSGASGSPIRLTSYGTGAKPIITAAGAAGAVIKLLNVQYWEISGLELRNPGSTPAYRSGILAENSSGTTLRHITVTGMTISDISGWSGGWYSTNAGVGIQTDHTTTVSTWDDIVVADNTFTNVDRIAIAVTPDADGDGTGLSTNVKIQRNTIRYSGGDDILVVKGSGAVIEGNDTAYGGHKSLGACPPSGQYCNGASASIWMSGSNDTVVQGNSVTCFVNEADGQAYDVYWGNHNTTFQYNYSRNNRGGMILIMPPFSIPNEPLSTVASDGTVIRYNVSVDDTNTTGCPLQPASQGPKDVIHFAGNIPNRSGSATAQPDICNNTIFIPADRATYVIGSRTGVNTGGSLKFRNNLVVNFGTGGYVNTTGSTYANNIMYGNRHSTEPANSGTVTLDPQLAGPLPTTSTTAVTAAAFQPRASSPAVARGVAISGNGGRDYAGNPIGAVPTIGAFEVPAGNLVGNGGFDTGSLGPWALSGNGAAASVTSSAPANGGYALQTGPVNSGVQTTITGLTAGATYLLTGWTRVATAGEQISIGVKDYGSSELYARNTATTWAPVSVYFTTGASSSSATIYCYKNAGTGAGYCDNLSVQRVSTPANAVANPGFETGVLSPWITSGSGPASTVAATAANAGGFGLSTGASASGAQQTLTGLTPGTSYVLSGWARATGSEQIAIGVKGSGSAETFQSVTGGTYAPVTVTFTTATNATTATVYCYKNAGAAAGACDDLRVTALG